jgi:hypothetical protein
MFHSRPIHLDFPNWTICRRLSSRCRHAISALTLRSRGLRFSFAFLSIVGIAIEVLEPD